jgi:UDP:flavonoid glycosyltransferase YjiC (YdhE family)
MRILFTCFSGNSHFYNTVPLAFVARAAGHEVTFSSAPDMAQVVAAAGFPFLPAGPGRLRMRAEILRSHADEISDDLRDWRVGARMFGDIAPRLRWRRLAAAATGFRPDAIVSEALEFAGPLVARMLGIPHFMLSIGPFYRDSLEAVWERAEPLFQSLLGPSTTLDDLVAPYIDICPPTLQTPEGRMIAPVHPVRLRPYHGKSATPAEMPAHSGRPRVLITFGTVSNRAIHGMYSTAARLAARGADVTLTLGPQGWFDWCRPDAGQGATATGTPPPGVRVVDYVPLDTALPATDVLVHHGGANTLRAALEYGVPALVIPQGAEQYRNARWTVHHGLGRMAMPEEATPQTVADTVLDLLADSSTARRLDAAGADWRAMPSPTDTLDAITRRSAAAKGGTAR